MLVVRIAVTIVATIVAWGACGSEAPPANPIVTKSQALVQRMCACTDAACKTAVMTEWDALVADKRESRFAQEDIDKLADLQQKLLQCGVAK